MSLVPASDLRSLLATEYLAAVAVTVSIWDHLLNIDKEVELVWRRKRWNALQLLIMSNLYGGQASIIFLAYILDIDGLRTKALSSRASVILIGVYGTLATGCAQFALLLRIHGLWNSNKGIKYALFVGFVLCYGTSVAFAIVTLRKFTGSMQYSEHLRSCVMFEKPHTLIGVWGGMMLYDAYVLVLLVGNALNLPRRHDSEILANLKRDGVLTFLGLSALRLAELLPSITGDASDTFLTLVITWALENILSFRLYLKIRATDVEGDDSWQSIRSLPVLVMEEVEMRNL